ncbi:hypothetical protein M2284_005003 [Rhodococcus sp. LBL1]|nr:hypothetical protein [Rhodococcus sp. LBL1]MDH6684651.1 hypothetical protein [Rhodococcus sp. LBL2]
MTETKQQTILEQLGGLSGLVYSSLPVIAFVPANSLWGLGPAVWIALGVAAAILVWRIIRRGPIQPAISGFLGVGVCAFIAYRTGDAKGYFLFGIYTSLLYAAAFVVSILVRWPLVGVVWGYLNGHKNAWRAHKSAVRAYDIATVAWALVFAARYLVQSQLYDADQTGWLAVARIGMGWPLTGVVLLVTIWAVRRADRVVEPAPSPEDLGQIEGAGDGAADRPESDIDRGA